MQKLSLLFYAKRQVFNLLSSTTYYYGCRKNSNFEGPLPQKISWYKPTHGQDTGIRIYNVVAKRVVPFIIPNENYVTWYTCGPTVYDSMHLGHASCYVKLDIVQRLLRNYFNINLVTAMNVTDIDDKIIWKANRCDKSWTEVSQEYESEFWSDMRKLNIVEPNVKVRVTDHMPKIIEFITKLITEGFAYIGNDRSVYFSVDSVASTYGKLQSPGAYPLEKCESATAKRNPRDFALWKARKILEPFWESPWGPGRPGWHIECSALASNIFGSNIDIHAGGQDLKFPHHENEETQSCAYHNVRQWVNYWIHTGHLYTSGEKYKMSKSLYNTLSVQDMLTNYSSDEFRMACIMSNYRNNVEYGDELMEMAKNTLHKFKSFRADCEAYLSGKKPGSDLNSSAILQNLSYTKNQIHHNLCDDFDTAHALTVLLDQIGSLSRNINSASNNDTLQTATCLDAVAAVDNFIQHILRSFGFMFVEQNAAQTKHLEAEIDLNALMEDILHSRKIIRDEAVVNKSEILFKASDHIRNCLKLHGIEIRDHALGSSWTFVGCKNKE